MGPGCFHPRNTVTTCSLPHHSSLQWGRDVSIPEMWLCAGLSAGSTLCFNGAGMFPSQKYLMQRTILSIMLASMGPGCFHPRNITSGEAGQMTTWLQWGRDVSIPEIHWRNSGKASPLLLQWGRDVSIPEIPCPVGRVAAHSSFNGAGMFPSQKFA